MIENVLRLWFAYSLNLLIATLPIVCEAEILLFEAAC